MIIQKIRSDASVQRIRNKKLKRGFQKKMTLVYSLILCIGLVAIGVCFHLDNNPQIKDMMYQWLKSYGETSLCGKRAIQILKELRNMGRVTIYEYGRMAINYTAILESAVIFFYSVSDNRRVGIPHRTIIAYSIGSLTIPILFIVSLVLSLFVYAVEYFGYNYTFAIGVLYVLFVQVLVIVEILWSTSFWRTIKVVERVEDKQYKTLKKLGIYSYANLDIVRHIEQAFLSNEITTDKVRIARKLLRIPVARRYWKTWIWKNERKMLYEVKHMYSFYYNNVISVLHHFNDLEGKDIRNTIYLLLYELLNEMETCQGEYNKCKIRYKKSKHFSRMIKKYQKNFLMAYSVIISGIMNAVQISGMEESSSFCNYVLNNCISDLEIKRRQTNLYILFQEMRFAIDNNENHYVLEFSGLDMWDFITTEDVNELAFFWDMWGNQYSLTKWKKGEHFWRAIQTMRGYGNLSSEISYIIGKIGQMRKKDINNNEDKIFSVD